MKIKFENGSIIESIESSDGKRSRGYRSLINPVNDSCDYVKGRRLTDEEYKEFIFREQVNAEDNLDRVIRELECYNQQLNLRNS